MDYLDNQGTLISVKKAGASSHLQVLSQQLFERIFFRLCQSLQAGQLSIVDARNGEHQIRAVLGNTDNDLKNNHDSMTLRATIQVNHADFYRRVVTGGANGAAESYIRGEWQTDNLTKVMEIMLANREVMDSLESPLGIIMRQANKLWHATRRNSHTGSRKNIAAHYDLGNEFFKLFLDSRLMYSSALYQDESDSLETASEHKLKTIVEKLDLSADDHLLEIGSGWGGLAIYAAANSGCRVTTITLSQEQYTEAKNRIEAHGLEHLVEVRLQDYRDVEGTFDKIVSIEMVEAVGHQYLPGYFETIDKLLKKDGMALIQAITIDDMHYEQALKEVDFIKRYVFPGSFIPCASLLTSTAAKNHLRLYNLEDLGASYALTLNAWRQSFIANLSQVRDQGYNDEFINMWNYYLSYCEGGFRAKAISVVQMLFTKPIGQTQKIDADSTPEKYSPSTDGIQQ